jgi:hypothetical protein
MQYEPNLWGRVTCSGCGKSFMTDCGWDFCSSSCEDEYDRYHTECGKCGKEQEEDTFIDGICEGCLEEEEMTDEAI